jgi:hypothetical protein
MEPVGTRPSAYRCRQHETDSVAAWSPQLNPVEHLWDEVREKWFSNRVFASLQAVEERLVAALQSLEEDQQRVASLSGFDWIISIPLNAH